MSPFHIGNGTEAYVNTSSTLHSDTIVSALASIRASLGQTNDLKQFMESFAVSNAFPYIDNIYFVPMPKGYTAIRVKGEDEVKYRKKLKKIEFVDRKLYSHIIEGKTIEIDKEQIQGKFLFATIPAKPTKIISSNVMGRAFVPRESCVDTQPFSFEWFYCAKNAGLYFLTDANGEQLKEIENLTKFLGTEGIGTDRSVGGGHFEIGEVSKWEIDCPQNCTHQISLSFYIPTYDELDQIKLEDSKYSLLNRGGYMSGASIAGHKHLRRKNIYGFSAGSVFSSTIHIKGKIVDVKPDWNAPMHPVYRSGKTIAIPCVQKD